MPPTTAMNEEGKEGGKRDGKGEEEKRVEAKYICQRLPLHRDPVPPLPGLDQALVAIEWGNERSGGNFDIKVRGFRALAAAPDVSIPPLPNTTTSSSATTGKMVHSLRSLGSAALNCCSVARGDLDAYWEGGCWAWDVAAGWVVVEEAGGRVVSGKAGGWEVGVDERCYLVVRGCGGEGEREKLVEGVWEAVGGGGNLEY